MTQAMTLPMAVEIPFHGDTLLTVEQDGQPFVAIKPICERLGLAWQPQHRKLTDPDNDWGVTNLVIPSAGGLQETTCLSLLDFPLWLATITPNRVKEELRDVLKRYRREAKQVLFDHFITSHRQLEGQLAACHAQLLALYPRWAKIHSLKEAGVSDFLVWKRTNLTREHYDGELIELERCGLLEPGVWISPQYKTASEELRQLRFDLKFSGFENKRLQEQLDAKGGAA